MFLHKLTSSILNPFGPAFIKMNRMKYLGNHQGRELSGITSESVLRIDCSQVTYHAPRRPRWTMMDAMPLHVCPILVRNHNWELLTRGCSTTIEANRAVRPILTMSFWTKGAVGVKRSSVLHHISNLLERLAFCSLRKSFQCSFQWLVKLACSFPYFHRPFARVPLSIAQIWVSRAIWPMISMILSKKSRKNNLEKNRLYDSSFSSVFHDTCLVYSF